jgi:endoribonuclease LACTB2
MASLNLYLGKQPAILYPAHGPTINGSSECQQTISTYITHRQQREDQIVSILGTHKTEGMTAREIVEMVYEGLGEGTWAIAIRPVGSHLRKLQGDGRVEKRAVEGEEVWRLLG